MSTYQTFPGFRKEVFLPGRPMPAVPAFLLLPVLWGVWNVLWARVQPPMEIGVWGALLGALAATLANGFLWWTSDWFAPAGLLFLPGGRALTERRPRAGRPGHAGGGVAAGLARPG